MGEEFYSTIKLITGEEIFGTVSVEEDMDIPVIIVEHPVVMKMINTPDGSIVKVKSWMQIPGEDPLVIRSDKIVTMTEVKDPAIIAIYENYLQDERFQINEVGEERNNVKKKLTDKMGYITTVQQAREYLEGLYKQPNTNKES